MQDVQPWRSFDDCCGAWKFPAGLMQFLKDAGFKCAAPVCTVRQLEFLQSFCPGHPHQSKPTPGLCSWTGRCEWILDIGPFHLWGFSMVPFLADVCFMVFLCFSLGELQDVIGVAKTGSGKTLGYLLPGRQLKGFNKQSNWKSVLKNGPKVGIVILRWAIYTVYIYIYIWSDHHFWFPTLVKTCRLQVTSKSSARKPMDSALTSLPCWSWHPPATWKKQRPFRINWWCSVCWLMF